MWCMRVQSKLGRPQQFSVDTLAGYKDLVTQYRTLCEMAYFQEAFNVSARTQMHATRAATAVQLRADCWP